MVPLNRVDLLRRVGQRPIFPLSGRERFESKRVATLAGHACSHNDLGVVGCQSESEEELRVASVAGVRKATRESQ